MAVEIDVIGIRGDSPFGSLRANVYLIKDGDAAYLIDAGFPPEQVERNIVEAVRQRIEPDLKLKGLFLTHSHIDHAGGVAALIEAFGGPVYVHPEDAALAGQLGVDLGSPRLVGDGEQLALSTVHLQAVHTPGHTPGHLCYLMPETKVLFSGDTVLMGTTTIIPPDHGDMADYMHSLERLLRLDQPLETLAPGHGKRGQDPSGRIRQHLEQRQLRERTLLKLLEAGPQSREGMARAIYQGQLSEEAMWIGEQQVDSHLKKLVAEERVEPTGDGRYRRSSSRSSERS